MARGDGIHRTSVRNAKQFYEDAYKAAVKIAGGEQYILSAVMHADERNRAMPMLWDGMCITTICTLSMCRWSKKKSDGRSDVWSAVSVAAPRSI